jgi:hypothetical protein
MAAPNLLSLTTVTGKSAGLKLTTNAQNIVENSAASGKVYRVKSLYITNVDGTNTSEVVIRYYDADDSAGGGTNFNLTKTLTVPVDATIDIISKEIYLEEGDNINLSAQDSGDLHAICSWEEVS